MGAWRWVGVSGMRGGSKNEGGVRTRYGYVHKRNVRDLAELSREGRDRVQFPTLYSGDEEREGSERKREAQGGMYTQRSPYMYIQVRGREGGKSGG